MAKKPLRIGLIGTGFMAKAHVFGYATAARVFDLPFEIVLDTVADVTEQAAQAAARRRLQDEPGGDRAFPGSAQDLPPGGVEGAGGFAR